ncbi:hypothetical protein F8M41_015592 [Gigaspora margarita]|uniref:Uncharacterized protein n=1 Tax=Gigaspora margarita TaxID=4874 RepID=A0A8H4ENE7_GIGMA|nr:hypothetical protein F8M41_015592 [Gigaspora margarita]
MTSLPLEWFLIILNNLDKSLIPKKIYHDNNYRLITQLSLRNNNRTFCMIMIRHCYSTSTETSNSIVHGIMVDVEQQHFTILRCEPIWYNPLRNFKW